MVELIVSVLIVIILSGISAVAYNFFVTRSKITACEVNTLGIAKLVQTYSAKWNGPITEMDAAALDVANANGWDASISYSALDYGSSIPGEVKRIQITENVDTSQMELTVTLAEYTGRGLYYPVGEIGAAAQGTLVCEEGGSDDETGGGTGGDYEISYLTSDLNTAGDTSCPTVTLNGAPLDPAAYSYGISAEDTAELTAAGLSFDPVSGCFVVVDDTNLPTAYSDVVSYGMWTSSSNYYQGARCGIGEDQRVRCWGQGYTVADPAAGPVLRTGLPDQNVLKIDAEHQAACALMEDTTLWCWGNAVTNPNANFGNGPYNYLLGSMPASKYATGPLQVQTSAGVPLTGVTDFNSGVGGSCAVVTGGDLYCWGDVNGAAPGADSAWATKADQVGAGTDVGPVQKVAVTGGICVINTADEGWCWGSDSSSRYGLGNMWELLDETVPHQVELLGAATDVATTAGTVCFVLDNGRVQCAGDNTYGQAGQGVLTDVWPWTTLVKTAEGTALGQVVSIDSTANTFCAAQDNGQTMCWGRAEDGVLGRGTVAAGYQAYPLPVYATSSGGALSNMTQVALGTDGNSSGYPNACALQTDGTVWCWGDNNAYGQLGDGTTGAGEVGVEGKSYPVKVLKSGSALLDGIVVTATPITSGVSGESAGDGVDNLVAFNLVGNVTAADPTPTPSGGAATPIVSDPITLTTVTQVPELPLGVPTGITYPIRDIDGFNTILNPNVTSSAPGAYSFSTNKSDADLADANLLFDKETGAFTPANRFYKYDQVAVAGADWHNNDGAMFMCGLTDGAVKCWGYTQSQEPRAGGVAGSTYALEENPKSIPLPGRVTEIYGDGLFVCGMLESAQVYCWGWQSNGWQREPYDAFTTNDTTTQSLPPSTSTPTANVIDYAKGGYTTCSVVGATPSSSTGTLYCGGSNRYGQLGRGTNTTYFVQGYPMGAPDDNAAAEATEVTAALGNVAKAATGLYSTCAIDDDGSVSCWGSKYERAYTYNSGGNYTYTQLLTGEGGTGNPCTLGQNLAWGCEYDSNLPEPADGTTVPARWVGYGMTPADVNLPGPASEIAAGDYSACAVVSGNLHCWGFGTNQSAQQTGVSQVQDLVAVTGMGYCFIHGPANTPACLTSNGIEDMTTNGTDAITGATSISAAAPGSTVCATVPDGSIWCQTTDNSRYVLNTGDNNSYTGAVKANYTGPYPTLSDITVTATGATSVTSSPFTIGDVSGGGTTVTSKPPAPATLTALAGDGEVALSWTGVADSAERPVSGYRVFRWNPATFTYTQIAQTTDTEYTDLSVTNGTSYTYAIATYGSNGQGPRSAAVTALPYGVPDAPAGLAGTVGDGTITLTWTAAAANGSTVTDYQIQWREVGGTFATLDDGTGTGTSTLINGLVNGTEYEFRVRATNGAGSGPWSSTLTAAPATVPAAPLGLNATAGAGSATLTWGPVTSEPTAPVTGYRLFRSVNGGATYTQVYQGTALTYTNTGLTNGTVYTYAVAAYGSGGQGAYSASVNVTPVGAPTVPRTLSSYGDSAGLTLSWIAPSNDGGAAISSYTVEYSTNNGTSWTSNSQSGLTFNVPGPLSGTVDVRVKAVNALGGESPWATLAVGIDTAPPSNDPITNPIAVSLDTDYALTTRYATTNNPAIAPDAATRYNSVWYSFTPATRLATTFSFTAAPTFTGNAALIVYNGTTVVCASLTIAPGTSGGCSTTASAPLSAGVPYTIAVYGTTSGGKGAGVLRVTGTDASYPANDLQAGAITIAENTVVTFDNTWADPTTRDAPTGANYGRSVWYRLVVAEPSWLRYTLTAGTGTGNALRSDLINEAGSVVGGTSLGASTSGEVATTSWLQIPAGTYWIRPHEYRAASYTGWVGTGTISYELENYPANETQAGSLPLSEGQVATFDNTFSDPTTKDAPTAAYSGRSLWYELVLTEPRWFNYTLTAGEGTGNSLRADLVNSSGVAVGGSTATATGPGVSASLSNWLQLPAGTYWLRPYEYKVSSFLGWKGTGSIEYTTVAYPVNDLQAGALPISEGETATFDNTWANPTTKDAPTATNSDRSLWYRFELPQASTVRYTLTSGTGTGNSLRADIVNQAGSVVNSSLLTATAPGASSTSGWLNLPAGTYWIRPFSYHISSFTGWVGTGSVSYEVQ